MESLGYGTHVTVDAFEAAEPKLLVEGQPISLLQLLMQELEGGSSEQLAVEFPTADGSSAGLLQGETQLFLHVFPAERRVSMRLFTRRDVPVSPLLLLLRQQFATSRFESHMSSVSKLVDANESAVKELLAGDRAFALSRFQYLSRGS